MLCRAAKKRGATDGLNAKYDTVEELLVVMQSAVAEGVGQSLMAVGNAPASTRNSSIFFARVLLSA